MRWIWGPAAGDGGVASPVRKGRGEGTVDVMRARLAGAGSLADTLASGWDAFELMRAVTIRWPVVDDRLFAAFMLASASAATGRDAVGLAPSLPPGRAAPTTPAGEFAGDVHDVADALGRLASALCVRLRSAASAAADPGDSAACARAASEADTIQALLAGDG